MAVLVYTYGVLWCTEPARSAQGSCNGNGTISAYNNPIDIAVSLTAGLHTREEADIR